VAGLLLGDLLANVGTGMIIVAMPVQTLSLHGSAPKAIAIGLVEAAPFGLATGRCTPARPGWVCCGVRSGSARSSAPRSSAGCGTSRSGRCWSH
jgi:hypothetical protein